MSDDGPFRIFVVGTKLLMLFTLPFLAFGYGAEVLHIPRASSLSKSGAGTFFLGVALFLPIWWLARRYSWRSLQFVCTLEHELTHAVVGVPFLLIPRRLYVTVSYGGHVKQFWNEP